MSRSLLLVRHAKQSGLAVRDHERPLTDQGREAAHRVGQRLHEDGPLLDRAICSTALRCRETWQALAAAIGSPPPVDFEPTLYNASAQDLLEAIAGVDETVGTLLVLAHNPGISVLGLMLAGTRDEDRNTLSAGFSTGAMACFAIEGAWSTISPARTRLLRFDPTS
jgi:phosphohistidine phosphatase